MLQNLMTQIKDKVNYGTELGLNFDIQHFFVDCEDVNTADISIIDGKSYKVSVKLKEFNMYEAKKVFTGFLHFIEYPAASFYIRSIREEFIGYTLLSFDQDMIGFYCEIEFTA